MKPAPVLFSSTLAARALADRIDQQVVEGIPTHEQRVIELLEEIRDTLQGRRGLISMPTREECDRYGRAT